MNDHYDEDEAEERGYDLGREDSRRGRRRDPLMALLIFLMFLLFVGVDLAHDGFFRPFYVETPDEK